MEFPFQVEKEWGLYSMEWSVQDYTVYFNTQKLVNNENIKNFLTTYTIKYLQAFYEKKRSSPSGMQKFTEDFPLDKLYILA